MANDWEQLSGLIDGNYVPTKQLYRLSFKDNNIAELDIDRLGAMADPGAVVLSSVVTRYNLDTNDSTISFMDPLDTLFNADGDIAVIIRMPKLKILQLDAERLTTESVESVQSWNLCSGKNYFEPID